MTADPPPGASLPRPLDVPLLDVPLLDGPVRLAGLAEVEPTPDGLVLHRLPAASRAQLPDDFVTMCEEQPAGVRLLVRTSATVLELDVRATRTRFTGRPVADAGRYEAVVDGAVVASGTAEAHGVVELDPVTGLGSRRPGPVATVRLGPLPTGEKDVEVWLPYGEITVLVALRADAPVAAASEQTHPRWVHHGSSISHGASATAPTGTWPVVAAREAGLDLVNLGLSGNALLDPFTARAIRDQPADVITLKLGINVANHDGFRRRTFAPAVDGFLDTVREGHPDTPVVVISPILCPMVEDRPGPTSIDPDSPGDAPSFRTAGRPEEVAEGKLSLAAMREILAAVVARRRAAGDEALTYLDGRELFGEAEWNRMPMPDLLHPDDAGHRHMGERFAALLPGLAGLRR